MLSAVTLRHCMLGFIFPWPRLRCTMLPLVAFSAKPWAVSASALQLQQAFSIGTIAAVSRDSAGSVSSQLH